MWIFQLSYAARILFSSISIQWKESHVVNVFIKLKIFLDIKCYYCCWLCIPLNIIIIHLVDTFETRFFFLSRIQQAFSYSNKYWMIFLHFLPSFNLFLDFYFLYISLLFTPLFFLLNISVDYDHKILFFFNFFLVLLISFLLPILHIHVQSTRWDMGNGI